MRLLCFVIILLTSLILFLASSCNDSITDSSNIVFPDSAVSFQNHVQPFMRVTCSSYYCHSLETAAGGRVMVDYSSLIFDAANVGLIVPGNPDQSVLCMMLENKIPHSGYIYWTSTLNQRNGIRKWIAEGAKDN